MASIADEAERALIAACIIDNETISRVPDSLSGADFSDPVNGAIFDACRAIESDGNQIDLASISFKLSTNKPFIERGGARYLVDITNFLPSSCNALYHAQLVANEAAKRKLCVLAETIKHDAQTECTAESIQEKILTQIDAIGECATSHFVDLNAACAAAFKEIEECGKGSAGIKSGFVDLDEIITDFRPGTLSILGARPAMGKTALALNIISNAAIREKIPCAFFSLEMTATELATRIISAFSRVNGKTIKKGHLTDSEWGRLCDAVERLMDAPIYIDETSAISITSLRQRAMRLKRDKKIRFIAIDYLQLMTSTAKRVQNREQEIADIARGLKSLAKDLNVPILCLAQLNRALETRTVKRPVLSDLRESGSIEQDADNVIFIHRPAYYNEKEADFNDAEIIIAKQRNGGTGTVHLFWNPEITEFSNRDYSNQ